MSGRNRTARRRAGGKRGPAKRRQPSWAVRLGREVARHLGDRAEEVAGLSLLVVASLVALGLYVDLAGPVGRAIAGGAEAMLGVGALALPPLLLVVGGALLMAPGEGASIRITLGLAVAGAGGIGLLHVARTGPGAPVTFSDLEALREAAGLAGAAVGEPMQRGLGQWGAGVVLGAAALLGGLIAANLSARDVVRGVGAAVRWARRRLLALVELPELAERPDDGTVAEAARAAVAEQESERAADDESGRVLDARVVENGDRGRGGRRRRQAHAPDGVEQLAMPGLEPVSRSETHWTLPAPGLLKTGAARPLDRRLVEERGRVLEETLREFGVDARVVGMTVGPTVTRYEVELGAGVKVNRVTGLSHDIAYAMASPDVRIQAPIPGKSAIGIEVPNRQRRIVSLGELLATPQAQELEHPLEVLLGRDISGQPVRVNVADMPHVLIAGATGAGKSSCISSIVTSVLMRTTPEEVRMILVDPKRVELGGFNGLPHLLTPVVVDPKKAANSLGWAVQEMERRYEVLAHFGVRDIAGYHAAYHRGEIGVDPLSADQPDRLPYMLVIVDELNDLMMVAARDVESSICRIAQMARAVGIHLIIATQRPSVDVITGVIKANIPARLAFSVSSLADSRVILDASGAEKLVGQGDLLLVGPSGGKPVRIQGAWVDEEDLRKVVAHWRRQVGEPDFVEGLVDDDASRAVAGAFAVDDDALLEEAMDLVVRSQLGSTSMLQRKLRVGFARAGRLMDLLERRGVVGPSEGSKARAVLMTVEELEQRHELEERPAAAEA